MPNRLMKQHYKFALLKQAVDLICDTLTDVKLKSIKMPYLMN